MKPEPELIGQGGERESAIQCLVYSELSKPNFRFSASLLPSPPLPSPPLSTTHIEPPKPTMIPHNIPSGFSSRHALVPSSSFLIQKPLLHSNQIFQLSLNFDEFERSASTRDQYSRSSSTSSTTQSYVPQRIRIGEISIRMKLVLGTEIDRER